MIRFACPACRSVLESPRRKAGEKVACPKCGQRLLVPRAVQSDARPPRPGQIGGDTSPPSPPAGTTDTASQSWVQARTGLIAALIVGVLIAGVALTAWLATRESGSKLVITRADGSKIVIEKPPAPAATGDTATDEEIVGHPFFRQRLRREQLDLIVARCTDAGVDADYFMISDSGEIMKFSTNPRDFDALTWERFERCVVQKSQEGMERKHFLGDLKDTLDRQLLREEYKTKHGE